MVAPSDKPRPTERRNKPARARRDALGEWYQVPASTFADMSVESLDKTLDAIRDTPSRWAGLPPRRVVDRD
ncbi:MAG TPA: hypothetical protein VGQ42_11000 [Candidatus Dormibacteraeota bacterium]|nr:hypothetical protein [Candidatus Dormibacteraeota bacterium]